MSDQVRKNTTGIVAAGAVFLGGTLGVAVSAQAQDAITSQQGFRAKLDAIKQAIEQGEVSPIALEGDRWVVNPDRKVTVGDWLQT